MNNMRSQIESLTAAEKADLLDQVWMSLEADSISLTDAQKAELDRRIADYERNPADVIPWEQVKERVRKPR
jgi:putative addiction module component (TIGR02574 family)